MGYRERKRARLIEQFVPPEYSPALNSGWAKAVEEGRLHWKYLNNSYERTHERCAAAFKMGKQSEKLKLMKLFEFVIRESVKWRINGRP